MLRKYKYTIAFLIVLLVFLGLWLQADLALNKEAKVIAIDQSTSQNRVEQTPALEPEPEPSIQQNDEIQVDHDLFIGETDEYKIRIDEQLPNTEGYKISLINKKTDEVMPISDNLHLFGGTTVMQSEDKKYLALSSGTSVISNLSLISVDSKKLLVPEFRISGHGYFWKNYFIYGSLNEKYTDRPWETGDANEVSAVNLKTKVKKVIFKADALNDYILVKRNGDQLAIIHNQVDKATDWENYYELKTNEEEIKYNLNNLNF